MSSMSSSGALQELCSMFEAIDRSVVQAVLEAVDQNVDAAIDQLLQISAEMEQASVSGGTNQEGESAAAQGSLGRNEIGAIDVDPEQKTDKSWRTRLPDDFLRLPADVKIRVEDQKQIERDQLLAQMLANEGFRRELEQHTEFREQFSSSQEGGTTNWQQAWQGLSEAAKTKFDALATKFRRNPEYRQLDSDEFAEDSGGPWDSERVSQPRRRGSSLDGMTPMNIS
mmetsp:Transcript_19768/g.35159  ORF Transcript_19768/g.35159 Transcript_19768/m.35159 type:complete len:226 (-) Transcript_19768:38-715(-)